jgi:hypothetical protein
MKPAAKSFSGDSRLENARKKTWAGALAYWEVMHSPNRLGGCRTLLEREDDVHRMAGA